MKIDAGYSLVWYCAKIFVAIFPAPAHLVLTLSSFSSIRVHYIFPFYIVQNTYIRFKLINFIVERIANKIIIDIIQNKILYMYFYCNLMDRYR